MVEWSLYTVTEAAKRVGVSRQRVQQWMKDGRLGTVRQGGRVFVSGRSLQMLIEWRRQQLSLVVLDDGER